MYVCMYLCVYTHICIYVYPTHILYLYRVTQRRHDVSYDKGGLSKEDEHLGLPQPRVPWDT